jgi:hypothetical protein
LPFSLPLDDNELVDDACDKVPDDVKSSRPKGSWLLFLGVVGPDGGACFFSLNVAIEQQGGDTNATTKSFDGLG